MRRTRLRVQVLWALWLVLVCVPLGSVRGGGGRRSPPRCRSGRRGQGRGLAQFRGHVAAGPQLAAVLAVGPQARDTDSLAVAVVGVVAPSSFRTRGGSGGALRGAALGHVGGSRRRTFSKR